MPAEYSVIPQLWELKDPLCPAADEKWARTLGFMITARRELPLYTLHSHDGNSFLCLEKDTAQGGFGLPGRMLIVASTQPNIVGHLAKIDQEFLVHRSPQNNHKVRHSMSYTIRLPNNPPAYQEYQSYLYQLLSSSPINSVLTEQILYGSMRYATPPTLTVLPCLYLHNIGQTRNNSPLHHFPHTIWDQLQPGF